MLRISSILILRLNKPEESAEALLLVKLEGI